MMKMRKAEFRRMAWTWIALGALLAWPGAAAKGAALCWAPLSSGPLATQSPEDEKQEQRDREQEKRDREQEKRDREQEKLGRQQELDDEGQEALDEGRYEKAVEKYDALANLNGPQTDKALYWRAWAERKLGRRDAAIASLNELYRRFPQSRWVNDGKALEVELRQSSGKPPGALQYLCGNFRHRCETRHPPRVHAVRRKGPYLRGSEIRKRPRSPPRSNPAARPDGLAIRTPAALPERIVGGCKAGDSAIVLPGRRLFQTPGNCPNGPGSRDAPDGHPQSRADGRRDLPGAG